MMLLFLVFTEVILILTYKQKWNVEKEKKVHSGWTERNWWKIESKESKAWKGKRDPKINKGLWKTNKIIWVHTFMQTLYI